MTKTLIGKIHMGIRLDFVIDGILEQRAGGKITTDWFQDQDHKGVSIELILSKLFELKSQGFDYYPMCDNFDNKGICLGHKEE